MRKQTVVADAYGKSRREVQANKQTQIDRARPEPQPQETGGVQAHDQKGMGPIQLKTFKQILLYSGIDCGLGH